MEYKHTQVGTAIIIALCAALVFFLYPPLITGMFPPPMMVIPAVLAAILILFYSLRVTIKNDCLTCSFGIGLIRKKILLWDIAQAKTVENPWYAGWGIHLMPGKCLIWNVSGFRAVELLLKNGNRFRIGTDEPEALVHAIEVNMETGK